MLLNMSKVLNFKIDSFIANSGELHAAKMMSKIFATTENKVHMNIDQLNGGISNNKALFIDTGRFTVDDDRMYSIEIATISFFAAGNFNFGVKTRISIK
jgi:hypothetical protein